MIALVTLDRVKKSLRVDDNDSDDILDAYILSASQAVIRYLKAQAEVLIDFDALGDSPPDTDSVPADIQAAVVLLVGYFYRDPDGDTDKAFEQGYLPRPVTALLYPLRDPAVA